MWAPLHLVRICSAIEQLPESIIYDEPAQPKQLGIQLTLDHRGILLGLLNGDLHAGGLKLSVAVRRDPRILQVQDKGLELEIDGNASMIGLED